MNSGHLVKYFSFINDCQNSLMIANKFTFNISSEWVILCDVTTYWWCMCGCMNTFKLAKMLRRGLVLLSSPMLVCSAPCLVLIILHTVWPLCPSGLFLPRGVPPRGRDLWPWQQPWWQPHLWPLALPWGLLAELGLGLLSAWAAGSRDWFLFYG